MRERLIPSTVRGRLAATYGILSILLVLGLGTFLVFSVRERYESRLASQLEEQALMAGSAVSAQLMSEGATAPIDQEVKNIGSSIATRLSIIDPTGRVVADSVSDPAALGNESNRDDTAAAIALSSSGEIGSIRSKSEGLLVVSVPVPAQSGMVARASTSLREVNGAVEKFQRSVIATALVVSWVTIVVALYVAGRITGPLEELRRHAAAVARGELDTSAIPASTRELGDLARAFNTMTRRVRDLVEESENSRSRLEAIFANLGDGVIIVDQDSTVIGVNDAALAILGTRSNWAVGRPLVVAARDVDLHNLLQHSYSSGKQQSATIQYAPSGKVFEAIAQPVDRKGERLGILVLRDVTELRRLEAVRREFVANVSHELRTPLASIRALVETLEAGAIDDPEVSGDFLHRVVGEVDRLTALVDELLDLARLESERVSLRLESIAPLKLISKGAERLLPQIERAKLTLRVDIASGLPEISVDRGRIEQVLLNLVHNAIKFSRPGGSITVSSWEDDGNLVVSVRDTGVGIASSELPRVFERFYKSDKARRSDGTGLGLAIAKHIVQIHGGAIWVESEQGRGTTFTFALPYDHPEPVVHEAEPIAIAI